MKVKLRSGDYLQYEDEKRTILIDLSTRVVKGQK